MKIKEQFNKEIGKFGEGPETLSQKEKAS